jgi:predicted nucleic acid-binding protein
VIVVADTSPMNYLIQVEQIDLLRQLYEKIIVPQAVIVELSHHAAPAAVSAWALHCPGWIQISSAKAQPDPELARLGKGEQEAILIALELSVDRVLMDELKGRAEARKRGLSVTGTLGILMLAGEQGMIEPLSVYRRLMNETSFRVSPDLEKIFMLHARAIG